MTVEPKGIERGPDPAQPSRGREEASTEPAGPAKARKKQGGSQIEVVGDP